MIDVSVIKDKTDKILIEEAIKLYENGFYRSSYIMAWLSGVESLRRRFEEGSRTNNTLKKVFDTIKSIENEKKSIDSYIIEKAKDTFMVSELEYQKLVYFYKMRCIFSHPYEQTPLVNDCEHIIKSIISIILSKDLLLGKDSLDSILDKIEKEQSYLSNDSSSINSFFKDILDKTDEKVYIHVLDRLSKFYDTYIPNNKYTDVIDKRVLICINVLFNQRPLSFFFHNDQQIEDFIYDNKKISLSIFSRVDILQNLSEHIQNIIITELITGNKSEKIANILNAEYEISERITQECTKYLMSLAKAGELKYFNAKISIERLIDLLKSGNFNKQNEVGDLIRNDPKFRKTLHDCSKETLRNFGRNIVQSANEIPKNGYGSNSCYYILTGYEESFMYPNEMIVGFILELFIKENYTLRPKFNLLETINSLLVNVEENRKQKILKAVKLEIEKAQAVSHFVGWEQVSEYSVFEDVYNSITNKLHELNPVLDETCDIDSD